MFHHWMSTDGETVEINEDTQLSEVSCLGCGVTTPEWGEGAPYFVSVHHATLPVFCPGQVENPHHFHAVTSVIGGEHEVVECGWCDYVIEDTTVPADVVWECAYDPEVGL